MIRVLIITSCTATSSACICMIRNINCSCTLIMITRTSKSTNSFVYWSIPKINLDIFDDSFFIIRSTGCCTCTMVLCCRFLSFDNIIFFVPERCAHKSHSLNYNVYSRVESRIIEILPDMVPSHRYCQQYMLLQAKALRMWFKPLILQWDCRNPFAAGQSINQLLCYKIIFWAFIFHIFHSTNCTYARI